MKEDHKDRNVMMLARADSEMVMFASAEQDNGFIKNRRVIEEKLLAYLANPTLTKPNYKRLAAEWGCKESTLKRLRGSMAFQSKLAGVIRDWLVQGGGGDILHEAFLQLRKGVQDGKPWAVNAALRIGGVLGSKEAAGESTPYEKAVEAAAQNGE